MCRILEKVFESQIHLARASSHRLALRNAHPREYTCSVDLFPLQSRSGLSHLILQKEHLHLDVHREMNFSTGASATVY